jgi:hypothetical protein
MTGIFKSKRIYIGPAGNHQVKCLFPVAGFSDELHIVIGAHKIPQSLPDGHMIIHQ